MSFPTIYGPDEWTPGAEGIFSGLTSEQYHQEAAGLSRSIAQEFVFRSPLHARYRIDHPSPPTKFMEVGTVVHCAVLEPERLAEAYYVHPPTYMGANRQKQLVVKPWRWGATDTDAWADAHADRPILSTAQETCVLGCMDALHGHPTLAAILPRGMTELSCFARYEGTLVRCRPDLMAFDKAGQLWVADLKKCQDASEEKFRWHAKDMRYDFQEAWYRFVLKLLGLEVHQFIFAAVEE